MAFKKGVSGNPGGRHKVTKSLQAIAPLNKDEVARIIGKYARMTVKELKEAIKDPDIPQFNLAVAKSIDKAATEGNIYILEFLLLRTIGKVKEEMDVKIIKPFVIEYRNGEKTILGAKLDDEPLMIE